MYYICIRWASYQDRDFDEREQIREDLRLKLASHGIRFLEYCWVWDESDRCLLMVGAYDQMEDARQWIKSLESMGFETTVRTSLPGGSHEESGIRRGWNVGSDG
jgi:hypothetical protein